jgi:hypothetical protein
VVRSVEGDEVGSFRHQGNDAEHRAVEDFWNAYSQSAAYGRGCFSIGLAGEPTSYAVVGSDICSKFDEVKSRVNSVIGIMNGFFVETYTKDEEHDLYVVEGEKLGWDPKVFHEEPPKPKLYLVRTERILTPEI